MKKLLGISTALLFMLGMAACSSVDESGVEGANGSLKLQLKGLGSTAVTYVTPETGETITGTPSVDIYRFAAKATQDGLFQEKTTITLQPNGADWVGDIVGLTGTDEYSYYITTNDGGHTSLAALASNISTEADMKSILTDVLAAQGKITTPLLITCKAANTTIGGVGVISGTLRRPMARFDVVHNDAANIDVLEVIVKDGSSQGVIFPGAATTLPVIGNYNVVVDATGFVYTDDGAGEHIQKSAFYLYPTELDNPTSIGVKVKRTALGSIEEILYVDASVLVDKNIKANYRYKLVVDYGETDNLVLRLVVVDWTDGGEYPVDHKTAVGFASDVVATGTATVDNLNRIVYVENDDQPITITFDLQASSPRGFSLSYDHVTVDGETITVSPITTDGAATYVAAYYKSAVSISVSGYYKYKGFERIITFTDNASPDAIATVRVISKGGYPGVPHLPTHLINGVRWAPVDIGSTDELNISKIRFQFGRNTPINIDTYTVHTAKLSYADAHLPAYANKSIHGGNANEPQNPVYYDWATDPSPDFWSGALAQGPCPKGWKVPTATEAQTIIDRYKSEGSFDVAADAFIIPSSDGKKLYLPLNALVINYLLGDLKNEFGNPMMWTSTPFASQPNHATLYWHLGKDKTGAVAGAGRSYGFRVRCVWDK